MKKFLIAGTIVDTDADKWSFEDVTPTEVRTFIKNLKDGEPMTFEITSPGGSCTAGLAIANLIKQASRDGHESTAHVIGLAASMASVITCACDKVQMDDSAFLMIHNPWSGVQGNADDMRKEADTLDKFKQALMSFYKGKFSSDETAISEMMNAETWFTGRDSKDLGFDCEVLATDVEFKAAACVREMPKFNNTPNSVKALFKITESKFMNEINDKLEDEIQKDVDKEEEEQEQKPAEETQPEEKPDEEKSEEKPDEETEEEKPEEEEQPEEEDKKKCDDVEKRVQGMQSAMAKQMDAQKKDFTARINDFQNQLKAKDEELTKFKAEVTSLARQLEESKKELSEMTSAYEEKNTALATLNAGCLTPHEELPTMQAGLARCKTPADKVAFLKSGKYQK